MFCKYCGKEINDSSVFCSNCGKKLIIDPNEISLDKKESDTRKDSPVIGILSICFSIFVIGLIFSIIGLSKTKSKKTYTLNLIGGILSVLFYFLYMFLFFNTLFI